jgi:predicted phage terminase large subunit-like protein
MATQQQVKQRMGRLETALLTQTRHQAETPAERANRQAARSSLLGFTRHTFRQYRADPAHELLAEALDAVVRGEITRLIAMAPPQHGKSELTSVRAPAYWLGRRPDAPVILTSYAASLAESKSRQARQVVESTEFAELFPGIVTRRDSRAVDHWELDGRRGGMLAAGVGGPITGHGGLLGVIDDPFENWEQSQSQTIRDKVWEWYRTTFRTRIWEGGSIILIATRWHEDDLAGRLLREQRGEWKVLRMPALAETQAERDDANRRLGLPVGTADPLGRAPGEPLCPSRFSRAALEQLRRDVGSQAWASQYQGSPRAPEGNRFKRHWLPIVDAAPARASYCRAWDKASLSGAGDFTAGVLVARDQSGLYFVVDVVRGQWSPGERNAVMRQVAELDRQRYGPGVRIVVEQEPGSGGKESAMATANDLAGYAVYTERPTGSKVVRAEPLAAQCEAGNVRLVRGGWNQDFIEEFLDFPSGKNDDQVDATAAAFNALALHRSSTVAGDLLCYPFGPDRDPGTGERRAEPPPSPGAPPARPQSEWDRLGLPPLPGSGGSGQQNTHDAFYQSLLRDDDDDRADAGRWW